MVVIVFVVVSNVKADVPPESVTIISFTSPMDAFVKFKSTVILYVIVNTCAVSKSTSTSAAAVKVEQGIA
jgi:hypothetical protein